MNQVLESARYQEGGRKGDDVRSISKPKNRKVHQISITSNLYINHQEIQRSSGNPHQSVRQLASVSVKNIGLPSEYSLSKQQMPQN